MWIREALRDFLGEFLPHRVLLIPVEFIGDSPQFILWNFKQAWIILKNDRFLNARREEEKTHDLVHADSPQAKGRIERLFGTFQNRLIKEMRLKSIKTIEEANRFLTYYLPLYAKRFAVQPANNTDLHRPMRKGIDLDAVFCVKTMRVLRNDFTVAYNSKLYQIEDNVNAEKVTVEERANGSIHISYRNADIKFKEITTRPKKERQAPKGPYIPPRTASWRRFRLPSSINFEAREEALAGAL